MAFVTQAAVCSLLLFALPHRALAQAMEHDAMHDCCGGMMGMGIGMMILVALLVIAATAALVAAALFLVRRSRENRP